MKRDYREGDFREHRVGRRLPRGLYMLRPTANEYAPVFMTLDTTKGIEMYRLVISRRSGEDRDMNLIYLGDRLCRWMHDSRLPETIKGKLAIIDVVDTDWKERRLRASYSPNPYTPPSNELAEVGWRFDKDMYTLIVPIQTIDSLRGESIDKENQK